MLLLIFYIHTQAYYTNAQSLECIIPNIAPPGALTWLSYKQQTIPVIDVCLYTIQKPAALSLSTRIGIVKIANGNISRFHYWAFRAENMRKIYPLASSSPLEETRMIEGISCKAYPLGRMQKALEDLADLSPYPSASFT